MVHPAEVQMILTVLKRNTLKSAGKYYCITIILQIYEFASIADQLRLLTWNNFAQDISKLLLMGLQVQYRFSEFFY